MFMNFTKTIDTDSCLWYKYSVNLFIMPTTNKKTQDKT